MISQNNEEYEKATFGGGCFWCIEAIFQRITGVYEVVSGYAGSTWIDPSYQDVCSGLTGHAEVCQIGFNPHEINYTTLLNIFFQIHDPTTRNRQGRDIGTQYRSIILYHSQKQKQLAIKRKEELSHDINQTIVTEINPIDIFYKAEDSHQNYFNINPDKAYCNINISPKIKKLKELYPHLYKGKILSS